MAVAVAGAEKRKADRNTDYEHRELRQKDQKDSGINLSKKFGKLAERNAGKLKTLNYGDTDHTEWFCTLQKSADG